MQCTCGGETHEFKHQVKTLAKAQEWDESVSVGDLPITIELIRCSSCSRQMPPVITTEKPLPCSR